MWQHSFETTTALAPEQIWPVIADVASWAEVDHNIASIQVDGTPAVGTGFRLKPKGGPTLKFKITAFDPPHSYADCCRIPGASMTTWHRILATTSLGEPTRIVVEIIVIGPLAWFWGPVAASKHAAGLPAQTERILARARSRLVATDVSAAA